MATSINIGEDRFRLALLATLVLQNTFAVVLGRFTRIKTKTYDINQFILVSECSKLLLSILLEYINSQGQLVSSFRRNVIQQPKGTTMMIIPALFYLVSNSLLYMALSNLTVPIFQVVYQGKLVITAIFSVFLLDRSISLKQWLCLFVISFGVASIVIDQSRDMVPADNNINIRLGCLSLLFSCTLSSAASVFFEKMVKSRDTSSLDAPSLWIRNIQISSFSIMFAIVKLLITRDHYLPFLHGFNQWVWLQVALFGIGGLLVSSVIKYADNVLKGLATSLSMIFASLMNVLLFGNKLTWQFMIGAAVTAMAVFLYSSTNTFRYSYILPGVKSPRLLSTLVVMIILLFAINNLEMSPVTNKERRFLPSDVPNGLHSIIGQSHIRPPGISDTEWLLTKPFSEIEDGDLLSKWESNRSSEEKNMLTFVLSITDQYDNGPPDVSTMPLGKHPNVRFIFFSDDIEYNVTSPWKHVKIPYPAIDKWVDFGYKNSLSTLLNNITEKNLHYNNMYTKYFCHLWWRVPELRRSRYVAYLGGGVNIKHAPMKFYDDVVNLLGKEGYRRFMMLHPRTGSNTIIDEAILANGQHRYRVDHVIEQSKFYRDNYRMPIADYPVYWLALAVYDSFHTKTRQVLFDTFAECQLWSLEDQISLPFALFFNKELNTTKAVQSEEFFHSFLDVPLGEKVRLKHNTAKYGQ